LPKDKRFGIKKLEGKIKRARMGRNGGENGRRMNLEAASIITVVGYYQDADESSFRSWT
jgi:hypothetical protein